MRCAAIVVAGMLVLAGARPARAQHVELAPFAGYRFGGSLQNISTGVTYGISGAVAYGGVVEVAVGHGNRFTVTYSRQETDIDTSVTGAGVPVMLQYLSFGGTRDLTHKGATRTFVTGGLGLLFAGVPGTTIGNETKFSLSASLGIKGPATARLGLRGEARGYLTFVGEQEALGTCGGGGCAIAFKSSAMLQGEVTAGIFFRF